MRCTIFRLPPSLARPARRIWRGGTTFPPQTPSSGGNTSHLMTASSKKNPIPIARPVPNALSKKQGTKSRLIAGRKNNVEKPPRRRNPRPTGFTIQVGGPTPCSVRTDSRPFNGAFRRRIKLLRYTPKRSAAAWRKTRLPVSLRNPMPRDNILVPFSLPNIRNSPSVRCLCYSYPPIRLQANSVST